MHMADALLSPQVGGAMGVVVAGVIAYSAKKVKEHINSQMIPLMGVMAAFVFAGQMINFTIPGTGSSGHIGGGMILAVLLGPYAAFLAMASILTVQALFFADGGLLALGCNIFNLGIFPCFLVYPFIYKKIVGDNPGVGKISAASIISVIVTLQLGAFSVVLETVMSGVSSLPVSAFITTMQPIHFAIGLVEGIVTALVINFIYKTEPELLSLNESKCHKEAKVDTSKGRKTLIAFIILAVLTGGVLSWFASVNPDGLEWSIAKVTGREEIESADRGAYGLTAKIQGLTAFLPDYGFKQDKAEPQIAEAEREKWPAVSGGTSVSGIVGGLITLSLVVCIGLFLKKRKTA